MMICTEPQSQKRFCNSYGLGIEETNRLNALFSKFSGKDRRLSYSQYKRLFKYLNPHLIDKKFVRDASAEAFLHADINGDKSISFDEFVNSYCWFAATRCSHPCNYMGIYSFTDLIYYNPYYMAKNECCAPSNLYDWFAYYAQNFNEKFIGRLSS